MSLPTQTAPYDEWKESCAMVNERLKRVESRLEAAKAALARAEIGLASLGSYQSAGAEANTHEFWQARRALTRVREVLNQTKGQSK